MISEKVTYTNPFTNEEVTETLYFNVSKKELIDIVINDDDDFLTRLQDMEATKNTPDNRMLLALMKDLIRRSYGERDNNAFKKSPEITAVFMNSSAYDEFIWSLFTNPDKAAAFITGVMPKELIELAMMEAKFQMPAPQDHLPKQTKNVFEHADLEEFEEPTEATEIRVEHREELTTEESDFVSRVIPEYDPTSVVVADKLAKGIELSAVERDWVIQQQKSQPGH